MGTADGVVRGAYQYVDSDGIVQTVNYIADALGFRVGASNLPVHHVDAPESVAEVTAPVAQPSVLTPAVDYSLLPYATSYGYNVPAAQVVQSAPVATPVVSVPVAAPAVTPAVSVPVAAPAVAVQAAQPVVSAVPADVTNSQFHAQDDIGQYNYGYSSPTSTKQELKTADGVTWGSYSYVDANGLVQTVNYISDALGFKVAATNLPVHHVEGPQPEPVLEAQAVEEPVVAAYKGVMEPAVDYSYLPYAQNYEYYGAAVSAPVVSKPVVAPVQVAPVAQAVVPVVQAVSTDGTQYHSQDDIGQYSFGYANGESVKQEVKTADGVVRGAYQYVDANGIVQTVNYIADALGFRVGATNLPVHHVEGPQAEPVQEAQAVEEPVVAAYKGVMEPEVDYSYLPYATSYGYNLPAPHVVAAPAAA